MKSVMMLLATMATCLQALAFLSLVTLPRGFSCLIAAVWYHPAEADVNNCEHFFNSLAMALIIAGNFNHLEVTQLRRHAPDKFNFKRDLQPSQKAETGRYLCSFDWPLWLSSFKTCSELLCVFEQVIYTRLDLLMPVRKVPMNTHAPWMMKHLKDLIQKRH